MTTNHGYDLDELATADVPEFDDRKGDGLPRIWWKYGTSPKQAGHFYVRGDDWADAPPAPWEPCDDLYDNETGFKAHHLQLVLITKRSQPYRKIKVNGKDYREYIDWPRRGTPWPTGVQIHTEYIVFADGLGGPVVLSFHGANGQAIEGKDGIVPAAAAALSKEATKLYKRKIGLSAFWLPIGPTMKPDGKGPLFREYEQGSKLNLPRLNLPALEGKALLSACYVGSEVLTDVRLTKDAYADWAKEMRGNEDMPTEASPVPGGRNIPQEISDDDVL